MGTTVRTAGNVMVVLALACWAAQPAWAQDKGGAQAPAGDRPVGQQEVISLDVKDANLVDVVKYIKNLTGKNILLGKNPEGKPIAEMWPPLTVTVQFEDVPWEQALKLVADSAKCLVERDGDVWTIYQPPEVTIEMERAELRDVVQAIAAVSGANIVVGSDVPEGLSVSVRLRNIPWFQALSAVVKSVGMTLLKEEGTEIFMIRDPDKLKKVLDTRVIRLRYIRPPEGYSGVIKNTKVQSPLNQPLDVKKRIQEFTLLNAVEKGMTKGPDGKPLGGIDYDIITNSLVLSDVASKLDEIEKIIEELDREPLQVQVDVKFVSTAIDDVLNVGINFSNGLRVTGNLGSMTHRLPFDLGTGGFEDNIGLSTNSSGTGFVRGPTSEDVAAFNSETPPYDFGTLDFRQLEVVTDFLKTDNLSTIVQRPSITVVDNFAATIFVGEVVRYAEKTFTASQAGGIEGSLEEGENSPISTGFQLVVVPHVVPGTRKILLTLVPTLDTLTGRSTSNPGFDTFVLGQDSIDLPRLSSATIVTQMMLEDGETAVLGGMTKEVTSETVRKIPLLGDIPLLGYLFKNIQTRRQKENIILFCTVRVVRSRKDAREALEEQLKARQKALRAEYYEKVRRTEYVAPEGEGEGDAGAGAGDQPDMGGGQGGNFYEGAGRGSRRLNRDWYGRGR